MKNVTDPLRRPWHLCDATKFPREFGVLSTTALKADAQVVVLSWGHLKLRGASHPQSGTRPEKGPGRFHVMRPAGIPARVKAAGMAVAGPPRHVLLAGRRPPVRLA